MDEVVGALEQLADSWCERRELKALATLLPAYVSNNGLTDGWASVLEALYDLRSDRSLPDTEQDEIRRLIAIVETAVYSS